MYRVKSPYAGGQGYTLLICQGCTLNGQDNWYECMHCDKKRCHYCKTHSQKDTADTMVYVPGAAPVFNIPKPEYPRGKRTD